MGEEKEICEIFSRNLRRFMEEANMNQKELAGKVGASTSQVSLWNQGKNVPRTNYLKKLTEIFYCQLSDLLTDKEKDPPPQTGNGPLPDGYESLNPANRALVDALIVQLAKSQSETGQEVDCAQEVLSTKR